MDKYSMSEDELEKKINRINKLSMELGLFVPILRYKIASLSPSGNVIDSRNGIGRSWIRNIYNGLMSTMSRQILVTTSYGPGYLSMRGVYFALPAGASYTLIGSGGWDAAVAKDDYGIVVGTGTGAESFESYLLGTLIIDGTTTGQLSYQECTDAQSYNAGTREFTVTWSRYFNNNSGGQIDVGETGIYSYIQYTSVSPYSTSMMMCRDLMSPVIEVTDGGQLLVEYAITLTYPA